MYALAMLDTTIAQATHLARHAILLVRHALIVQVLATMTALQMLSPMPLMDAYVQNHM
jgi:hypothetical protein